MPPRSQVSLGNAHAPRKVHVALTTLRLPLHVSQPLRVKRSRDKIADDIGAARRIDLRKDGVIILISHRQPIRAQGARRRACG